MNSHDDRLTFLLQRPAWVNDLDVSYCSSCNNTFSPLKRRHHCRNCGNIFCQECSSRKVALPQLGYGTKPERVCNSCFDVCYLVAYSIDEDHGLSTQIHGVRGLLELTEKDDEKDLHNMVAYGGVDALIWLCRSSKSIKLHHLTTTILALLAEKESIRPVIITKWALPPLLVLIRHYTSPEVIRKHSPPNSITSGSNDSSDENTAETRQSIILEIIINCTHILYQLSRAGILSQKEVIQEGVFDTLIKLASFNLDTVPLEKDASNDEQQQLQQHINERVTIIQNLAAKAISAISSLVGFQANIIELIQGTPKLSNLLRSNNGEVRKYMAKTIAYLSLRNDKYKPNLLGGEGSRALVSILALLPQKDYDEKKDKTSRLQDLSYYLSKDIQQIEDVERLSNKKAEEHQLNSAAVSHTCCALANFATNNESQLNLMSQPHILKYICNVPVTFPTHAEIHRHVARCLANLSLYEENLKAMLTNKNGTKDGARDCYNVLPTLLIMGKSPASDVHRHIVRAIDNLSSNLPASENHRWKELFGEAYTYICRILEEDAGNEKDADVIKRAKGIVAREKMLKNEYRQTDIEEVTQALEDATLKDAEDTESVAKIGAAKEEGSTTEESVVSVEESINNFAEHLTAVPEESVVATDQVTVSSTEEEGKQSNQTTTSKNKKKSKKNRK